ncbi:MAG: DUF1015 domain-containing protein, partial [bacterium]|nr:DUF1015 domain-containing protein [bacterium]
MPRLIRPFSGYVPTSSFGDRVAEPPGEMLPADLGETAKDDPLNFRRAAGRRARVSADAALGWLSGSLRQGSLQTVGPTILVYRQSSQQLTATGIIANVSLAGYDDGSVKRHERTVDKTRRRMADYMRTTRVYGNPVALAHRPHEPIKQLTEAHSQRLPEATFTTVDGCLHELWLVPRDEAEEVSRSFQDELYVTDGHHRLAAASLVAGEEGRTDASLLAGLFAT